MSWLAIDFGTSESSAAFMNNNGDLKKVKFTSPNSATLYDFPTTAWVNEKGDILDYNVYQAVLIVRYAADKKLYLYDIQNIKKETRYPSWTE